MDRFCIITRKGVINLKGESTSNQCAKEGHEVYLYTVKILFEPNIRLDEHGWIMEHSLIDQAVQKVHAQSCEIMSEKVLDSIETILKERQIGYVGIKLLIQPAFVVPENSAYFQEYRCEKENLAAILNL